MSQPQLLTIDFFGIASHQTEIPELNSAMDCLQQSLHTRSMQSCLGKITPHMQRQLISHRCFGDLENCQREDQTGAFEGMKTLDLFPQHPLGFRSNGEQDKSQSALLESRAVEKSNFNPPMAKRFSLQRFLQKRKDRLRRIIPYVASSK